MRILLLALAAALGFAQDLPLMPWPAQVARAPDELVIDSNFSCGLSGAGASDPRVRKAAERALYRLFRETGVPISQMIDDRAAIT
jgi:hypothetical protein